MGNFYSHFQFTVISNLQSFLRIHNCIYKINITNTLIQQTPYAHMRIIMYVGMYNTHGKLLGCPVTLCLAIHLVLPEK